MPRKRKVAVVVEEQPLTRAPLLPNIKAIMNNAQLYDTQHKKCVNELKKLYATMKHEQFMEHFLRVVGSALQKDEPHEYASRLLDFCAGFIGSFESEDTHPILSSTIKWLLSFTSPSQTVRFRSCEFTRNILDSLGPEAALDDDICEDIINHMRIQLKDIGSNVRQQAILSLQRLQTENIDNRIIKLYLYHLSNDPSPRVRQAVITSMVRNFHTIPAIIERLWDIDEKVRRHAYLQMSSYPVKAYKVSQRLTFLEQGLFDQSEMARKIVVNCLIPQWLLSYGKNYIAFVSALKLDANDKEVKRFRKITKTTLIEIFQKEKLEDLLAALPLDPEMDRFISYEQLTMETTIYWLSLLEYVQLHHPDDVDCILPDLTTFCSYVTSYLDLLKSNSEESRFEKIGNQFVLLTLIEIIETFDFGDEIGRQAVKELIKNMLSTCDLEEYTIEAIVRCTESIIPDPQERINFLVDNISETVKSFNTNLDLLNRTIIDTICEKEGNKNIHMIINPIKVKLLDLQEQERHYLNIKDYPKAQEAADKLSTLREQMATEMKPYMDKYANLFENTSTSHPKKMTPENICKCLQIALFMVKSPNVKGLTPSASTLFRDFLRMQMESQVTNVRLWALQCATAFSLLYENIAKDIYTSLCKQFHKSNNVSLWKISIRCLFELLDCYGVDYFDRDEKAQEPTTSSGIKRNGRQLYNARENERWDDDGESQQNISSGIELTLLMIHFWETCDDASIHTPVVEGVCRLVLHGHYISQDLISKLLLKFFNPTTEPEINQIIGVFMTNLIEKRQQECLQLALIPTLKTIVDAPYESPLREIKMETVIKFVVDSTRLVFCSPGLNIHNTIAMSFINYIMDNNSDKTLIMAMAKSFLSLEITEDTSLRDDLINCVEKLLEMQFDARTSKYITNFKQLLLGRTLLESKLQKTNDEEDGSDADEVEDSEKIVESLINPDKIVEETEEEVAKDAENETPAVVDGKIDDEKINSDNKNDESDPESVEKERQPATVQKSPRSVSVKKSQKRFLRKSILVREHNNKVSLSRTQPEKQAAADSSPKKSPAKTRKNRSLQLAVDESVDDQNVTNNNADVPADLGSDGRNNESSNLEVSKMSGHLDNDKNEDEGIDKSSADDGSDESDAVVDSSIHEEISVLLTARKTRNAKKDSPAAEANTNKTRSLLVQNKSIANDKTKTDKEVTSIQAPKVNGIIESTQNRSSSTRTSSRQTHGANKKTASIPEPVVSKSTRLSSRTKPTPPAASPAKSKATPSTPLRKKPKPNEKSLPNRDSEESRESSSSSEDETIMSPKRSLIPTSAPTATTPSKLTKTSSDKENSRQSTTRKASPLTAARTPRIFRTNSGRTASPATLLGSRDTVKVMLTRLALPTTPIHSHGTRRAAQEIYKSNNIMTRKRNSLEHIVSTKKSSISSDASSYRSSIDGHFSPAETKSRTPSKRKFVEVGKSKPTKVITKTSTKPAAKSTKTSSLGCDESKEGARGRNLSRNASNTAPTGRRSARKSADKNPTSKKETPRSQVNTAKTIRTRSRTTEKRKA